VKSTRDAASIVMLERSISSWFVAISRHWLTRKPSLNKRKVWVEPLFAEAKDWHGMRRFRLRRLWRVNCEALVIAAGHNLQQLLKKRGWGRRPFPTDALCASFWQFWVICSLTCESKISSFACWFSFFLEQEAHLSFLLMRLSKTFSTGWEAYLVQWREKSERGLLHEQAEPEPLPHGVTSSLTSFSCVFAGIFAMRSAIAIWRK
jgi:hypothetical protein